MKQKLLQPFKVICRYLLYGMLAQAIFIQPLFATDLDKQKTKSISQKTVPEDIEISGKVVDENGERMPGATVTVKGESTGVVTDMDGNYKITVDESAILVFSFVGYAPVEESIAGRSVIDVTLLPDPTALDEVVVTGYQKLSKERATGSFFTLTSDEIQQRPVNNFVNKLEGVTSGVAITPGGAVEIRGRSTIEGNADPLYVVDGFPLSGSTLTVNPEDIETITVLKDAAAASIWGVRASNGVIVVTTRKGSRTGTKINFSSFVGITEGVEYDKRKYMSSAQEIDLIEEYFEKGWYRGIAGEIGFYYPQDLMEVANIYKMGMAPDGEVWSEATYNAYVENLKTKDNLNQWEDLMLQNPLNQTYNLSIVSGSENNNIYASLVYNDNLGQSIGNSNDRIMLNIRDEFRFKDRVIFTASINGAMRNNTMNGLGASTVDSYQPAFNELVDEFGRTIQYYTAFNPWISQEKEVIDGYFPYSNNPLDQRRALDRTRQRIDVRSQFGIGVNIIEGLRFDTRFQYELGFDSRDDYNTMDLPAHRIKVNNYYLPGELDDDGNVIGYQIPVGDKYESRRNQYYAWDWRNTLAYDKVFGSHEISLFGGAEIRKHYSENQRFSIYGYNRQTTQYLPVDESRFRSGVINGWNRDHLYDGAFTGLSNDDIRELSVFANGGYTFRTKYSLTGSFRIDQKNLFGSDPKFRYKPLWSVGALWHISKEDFMSGISLINRLTLRATYGISGNASNEYSPYAQAVNQIQGWGGIFYDYLNLSKPANPSLKWEETATTNFGLDFALLQNRMSGSIELYFKNSTDLLGERPLDPTNGYTVAKINYASMTNRGIDVILKGLILDMNEIKWNAKLLFSYNKNKVTDVVNENLTPIWLAWSGALTEGKPLDNIYSFDYAGLSNTGDILINTAEGGVVNWRDYTGKEKEEDLIYYGTRKAPIYGGFSTTVSYKGFDLSVNMTYKFGYHFKHYYTPGEGTGVGLFYYGLRMDEIWATRWKEPGDELTTRVPRIQYMGINPDTGLPEDWWDNYLADWYWLDSQDNVLEGGFIKVKDIILGYNLSSRLLQNLPIESVRLIVQVTNPFLWLVNDRGIDPEHKYNAAWSTGSLKTYTFGIRAKF